MSLKEDSMEQEQGQEKLTSNQRHYARHREEKLRKVKERYHSRPDVIARNAARAQKKEEKARLAAEKGVEKEAEKELRKAERAERMKKRLERIERLEGLKAVAFKP